MSDLSELYQEVILDHNKRPRNFRVLEAPSHHAEGYNPLCGDRLNLYVQVSGDTITDVAFEGSGCKHRPSPTLALKVPDAKPIVAR